MAYDPSKDKVINKFYQKVFGLTKIQLACHQYGTGDAKLQITRMRRNDEDSDDWNYTKLGRLSAREVKWLGKRLPEIGKWMSKFDQGLLEDED